ncbi:unnamed protein product [Lymnaea stagnalis]|uniref:Uncharacterized protein n=1 Tax=Lymnaea stagnalis TaxID=6523 RepID=A0AAV2HFN9_LYMST
MVLKFFDVASLVIISFELYHLIAHAVILFGFRALPRKDLVRIRLYFLFDALTVFIASFVLTGRLKWLAVIQILQHLFYFITWDKSYMAKKIIDWSSLDWFESSKPKQPQIDSALGTFFDIAVHAAMIYVVGEQMDMTSILIAVIIAQAALYSVIFNPKFAWSSPNRMPDWVQKRIGKLALEQN